MILTCPECATRYFLPDVQIGSGGRKVKCAQCGAIWREFSQAEPQAVDRAGETAPAASFVAPPPVSAPEPQPEDDDAFSPGAARRADILREKKALAERKAKQAATVTAAVWAGLAAAVALLLVLAGVFREEAVKLLPGMASAYAAVGLPVNAAGLLIEKVHAAPSMLEDHRALMVTGALRNVAGAPTAVPAFRVDVLDKAGRPLDHKIIQIAAPPLKVGETRLFSLGVADPPAGYQDVAVTFALPRIPAAKAGAH
jgi:predicted Zn finger-like uncharacterized protein